MNILFIGFKYDYGLIERGQSLETTTFVPALESLSNNFNTFWLEEHGYPDNLIELQDNILKFSDNIKPDIIFFILMNNEIKKNTLLELKNKFVTINWFGDDCWRFNIFTKFYMNYFTYSITTDKFYIDNYYKLGYRNVLLSQWATTGLNYSLDLDNINYIYDITFVGSKNPTREWVIEYLKNEGFSIHCFGLGWPNGKVSNDQLKYIFLHSKINLNLSNSKTDDINFYKFVFNLIFKSFINPKLILKSAKYFKYIFTSTKNDEQIKARNFEIPSYGGFQISKFTLAINEYFDIGNEIIVFNNLKELSLLCKYYLKNNNERMTILKNSYIRSKSHTYQNRLKEIFNKINFNN
jgi:spore maturation protein CgeB